jgi:hypothetical protein
MSTRSAELRAAIRSYRRYAANIESDENYKDHMARLKALGDRYGRTRVLLMYRRYCRAVTIMTKNGVIYRRV